MKITFSNLGAIKKTTLDLRPLTVIIGPNNSNKTYIAYSIYGLLSSKFKDIKTLVSKLSIFKSRVNTLLIKFDENFFESINEFVKQRAEEFKSELDVFFQDSTHKLFKQTNFEIELTETEIKGFIERIFTLDSVTEFFGIKFTIDTDYIIAVVSDSQVQEIENQGETIEEYILDNINFLIEFTFLHRTFLLPAERNAFIITYKMLANRRYKLLKQSRRELLNRLSEERQIDLMKEQGDIRYPQPIEDFLDLLSDIELQKDTDFEGNYCKLADQIELNIQRSNKTNFKPTKLGGKEIKINIKKGLDIDLYNASSSIKQLAPLLLYLRYRARENDLLIVDEPEMNLHPESQAKLLEVLGMLVNAGVNVLLTTHSPYFMSHLNNLIAGDMTDDKIREKQAKSLYLGDERAFLKPEDVSAYEMRQNKAGNQTLHDLHDEDYGIRWDTLADVSDEIQQKFFEIYENGKKTSEGKEK